MATYASSKSLPTVVTAAVGYTLRDAAGTLLQARTNAGVAKIFDGGDYGLFQAEVTVPDGIVSFSVVWDDGAGNAIADVFNIAANNFGAEILASVDSLGNVVQNLPGDLVEALGLDNPTSLQAFQDFFASNPDAKSIEHLTTPVNTEIGIS